MAGKIPYSQLNGDNPSQGSEGPLPQLILPSATYDYIKTARPCFTQLAKTKRFFVKGRVVVEVTSFKGIPSLMSLK
jgi:hypothetical protein